MAAELPEDILHLICEELRVIQDLSTLFNLAVSSKQLAPLALTSLYRTIVHFSVDEDEARGDLAGAVLVRQKWAVYWRSITLASLGKAMYPYHVYLRSLDFRDLGNFLEDLRSYRDIEKGFFKGNLAKFRHMAAPTKWAPKGRLDVPKIVDDLSATIASDVSMIEVISGKITPRALQEWVSRMSRLQRLELEDGAPLADDGVRQAIYNTCPMFGELSIWRWLDPDSDEKLGKFITGLPEESLRVFITYSRCGVSTETCLALNRHGAALKTLAITIEPEAIPALALLGNCTSLEQFKLEASSRIDMQESHKETFDDFAVWLANCEMLRDVQLSEFNSAPAALTPLLLNDNVRLEKLITTALSFSTQYKPYHGEAARLFHQALRNQAGSLQYLDIRGQIVEGQEPDAQDADILVNSVSKLKKLTNLDLHGIMDDAFGDHAIINLLQPLVQLEDVSFAGYGITDKVLDTLSTLHNLKRANVNAFSRFTISGLLDFVDKLGPGNQGLSLAVDWPDHDFALSPEEIVLVSSAIESKVNGTFDYTIPRDPNIGIGDDSDAEYNGDD